MYDGIKGMQIHIDCSHLPEPGNCLMMQTEESDRKPKGKVQKWYYSEFYIKNRKGDETSALL